jgi:hypothetical protein
MLQPADTANILPVDVPFYPRRVVALRGGYMRDIRSTPNIHTGGSSQPLSPLNGRHPTGRYIYLLVYLCITPSCPRHTRSQRRYPDLEPALYQRRTPVVRNLESLLY